VPPVAAGDARDRLLLAAAELLDEAQGADVSTRAITDRAGVQAPTLYHHFGSKQGLLDAVVTHGFTAFLAERAAGETGDAPADPLDDIRAGWDLHVRYGLEHPAFYGLIYGRTVPGEPCGVVAEVEAMILAALRPAARQGRLRVPPARAARQLLAASTGVVLALISRPADDRDLSLSREVRDAILERLTTAPGPAGSALPDAGDEVVGAAVALDAALERRPDALSATETALLREWLHRLSASPPA